MISISHTVPGSCGSLGGHALLHFLHECVQCSLVSPPSVQGVFGLGKRKKSPIGFERVVRTLASRSYRAPDEVGTYNHCVCVCHE